MNQTKKVIVQKATDFLFEVGILAKTPRSGFGFLGAGKQSVAEHINRTVYTGMTLASMFEQKVDISKVMKMCLFHDLGEARVSDLNYVHQKYTKRLERKAIQESVKGLPCGKSILEVYDEYEKAESLEAKIAKDADQIELLLSLKEIIDTGHKKAGTWIPSVLKRIKTEEGVALTDNILNTDFDNWWFKDKDDKWWVRPVNE